LPSSNDLAAAVASHPDAALFKAAAAWRLADDAFDEIYSAYCKAERNKKKLPSGFHEAAVARVQAEERLVAVKPRTKEGALVLLTVAHSSMPQGEGMFSLLRAAIYGVLAVGI
jgi:hypothetical protein